MIKWIIEKSNIDKSYLELANEVKLQGMDSTILEYKQNINYNNYFDTIKDCVVFQGGMFFALHLLKNYKCIPCAWLTLENYKCSTYYSYLGKYLLNEKYIIMPIGDIVRNVNTLFNNSKGLFIRPNTGLKLFNAQVHHKENFKDSFSFISMMTRPTDLAILSETKTIEKEWRFICANKEIITGCQYKENNETSIKEDYPIEALNLAQTIANEDFQPDPMYTIDVCYSNGYKLVELNSFSCAGLYACNIPAIVEIASKIAQDEWNDLN